jgi:hypothetical protein
LSSAPDRQSILTSIQRRLDADSELEKQLENSERERVELDGRKRFFALRDKWSTAITVWISVFIAFHLLLTVAIGLKYLDFTHYQWLIPMITVENFLQIVGMGYVVVRFLYPSDSTSR